MQRRDIVSMKWNELSPPCRLAARLLAWLAEVKWGRRAWAWAHKKYYLVLYTIFVLLRSKVYFVPCCLIPRHPSVITETSKFWNDHLLFFENQSVLAAHHVRQIDPVRIGPLNLLSCLVYNRGLSYSIAIVSNDKVHSPCLPV